MVNIARRLVKQAATIYTYIYIYIYGYSLLMIEWLGTYQISLCALPVAIFKPYSLYNGDEDYIYMYQHVVYCLKSTTLYCWMINITWLNIAICDFD